MNIFDYLKSVTSEKVDLDFEDEEIQKDYDIRMMNRYISMCDMYLPIVNEINRFSNVIDKKSHYKYYLNTLPQRNVFFKYIKKDKDIHMVKKMLVKFFKISMKETDHYLKYLSDDDINKVVDSFTYGKNSQIEV